MIHLQRLVGGMLLICLIMALLAGANWVGETFGEQIERIYPFLLFLGLLIVMAYVLGYLLLFPDKREDQPSHAPNSDEE